MPPLGVSPDRWHVPKPAALYYCGVDPGGRECGTLPRNLVVVAVNLEPDAEDGGEVDPKP